MINRSWKLSLRMTACFLVTLLSVTPSMSLFKAKANASTASIPVINVWYGPRQEFGLVGLPQRWANIMGNVADPDGVAKLEYSLNNGAFQELTIGPDSRRLDNEGDFNIELGFNALQETSIGDNTVVIKATDTLGNEAETTVAVIYHGAKEWPLPFTGDWSSTNAFTETVQIVDGLWNISAEGIRTLDAGYDRLITLGNQEWDDYEIIVPVTVHAIDTNGSQGDPGVGIIMRWKGHVGSEQPRIGWQQLGAYGFYEWKNDDLGPRLRMFGNGGDIIGEDLTGKTLETGKTYLFKMQARRLAVTGSLFTLRMWEEGQPEPDSWDVVGHVNAGDFTRGSAAIIAHDVDATFGNIALNPLAADTAAPTAINIEFKENATSAQISWSTLEPSKATIDYGVTTGYGQAYDTGSELVTDHSVLLTNLVPETEYHVKITSHDGMQNNGGTDDLVFRTTAKSNIVSDDFNACELNSNPWSSGLINPFEDATLTMTGTHAQISIPQGQVHDILDSQTPTVPRIMQPANDVEFEVEVKFDAVPSDPIQLQGIMVQQDRDNLLRFDYFSDGNDLRIFAASLVNNALKPISNVVITGTVDSSLYMRVKRFGNQWTQSYSLDGSTWVVSADFDITDPQWAFGTAFVVNSIGPFVGNARPDLPANQTSIDYFLNLENPILNEDQNSNLACLQTGSSIFLPFVSSQ